MHPLLLVLSVQVSVIYMYYDRLMSIKTGILNFSYLPQQARLDYVNYVETVNSMQHDLCDNLLPQVIKIPCWVAYNQQ